MQRYTTIEKIQIIYEKYQFLIPSQKNELGLKPTSFSAPPATFMTSL